VARQENHERLGVVESREAEETRMNVRIAWNLAMSTEEWKKNPIYRTIRARRINQRWCAHMDQVMGWWTLTHIRTGFSAAQQLHSFKDAQTLARRLEEVYPPKAWDFKTPETAKRRPKAIAVIHKFRANTGSQL
jgi:hypothetical protein